MNDQGKPLNSKIDELLNEVGNLSKSNTDTGEAAGEAQGNSQQGLLDIEEPEDIVGKKVSDLYIEKMETETDTSMEDGNVFELNDEYENGEPPKGKKKLVIGIVTAIIVVLAGVFAVFSIPLSEAKKEELYKNGTFIDGVSVFDTDVSGKTLDQARANLSGKVDFNADDVLLELKMGEQIIPVKASNLQIDNTVDSVLQEAMLYGRDGLAFKRLMERFQAKNFDVAIYTDDASLNNLVNTIVTNYSVEAKDADVQLNTSGDEKFTFIPEQVGYQIQSEGLGAKIKNHIESKASGYVELDYVETQPKITEENLRANMVLRSSYSTNVSGATGRRKNVMKATQIINGKKINPGEEFNIEQELGPRTAANGWNIGGEFVNGELVNGYGGGICQVSTTLFNAVIRSDLEIVQRSNHSQSVGYVQLGFDATISSGGPYFIFKNNTDYPIYIVTSATMSKTTVEIYGAPLPYGDNITYAEKVSASGTVTSGRRVTSTLVFYNNGQEVHKISWSSSYRGKPVKVTTTASTTVAPTTAAPTTATHTTTPTVKPTTTKPTTTTTAKTTSASKTPVSSSTKTPTNNSKKNNN